MLAPSFSDGYLDTNSVSLDKTPSYPSHSLTAGVLSFVSDRYSAPSLLLHKIVQGKPLFLNTRKRRAELLHVWHQLHSTTSISEVFGLSFLFLQTSISINFLVMSMENRHSIAIPLGDMPSVTDRGSAHETVQSQEEAPLGAKNRPTRSGHTATPIPASLLSGSDHDGDEAPKTTVSHTNLSRKRIATISGLFLLVTVAFAVASQLLQSDKEHPARDYTDIIDPDCIDKLGDSGEPRVAQVLDLDLTFGNFTFTNAKIVDVAWDTAIGQGGRILHGWILYRCVMRRLLLYAMEHYSITYKYFVTLSFSRDSLLSFLIIFRNIFSMRGLSSTFCAILLVYALGYTLCFSLLWSAATGYVSLSHRLYAMPNGDITPINTHDLTLCWVLDGSRFGWPNDHIEMGPDFSTIDSRLSKTPFTYINGRKPCIRWYADEDSTVDIDSREKGLAYSLGGWKINTTTTIWDHFGWDNGSNTLNQASETFRSIRACGFRISNLSQHDTLG